jgi:ferredoxin-NADP reductase
MIDAPLRSSAYIPWQNAKIVEIIQRTARIKSFILALTTPFAHRAGQHVDLRLTAPDGLAIELLENGEVSPFFHQLVEVGDEIELRGPLGGHFVWSVADGGPLLMVGGGSGVVPLMAMIRHRQASAARPPALLLLSARRWDDVLYRDELIMLDRLRNGFALVLSLTREVPRRAGDYGRRVDAAMMTEVAARLPTSPKYVFICGSNAFVNAAADGAVAAGAPASLVRTERYGA